MGHAETWLYYSLNAADLKALLHASPAATRKVIYKVSVAIYMPGQKSIYRAQAGAVLTQHMANQ
jgi:hypothetical protein